ncbi:MAG TPA: sigma-70 family RNA polymerase sigma factor [Flavobacteriales bacterium]|nr:sigma-70 family RNA polymerase sigma factor [Flavobacteriales bacterium]
MPKKINDLDPEQWLSNYGDYLFTYARLKLPSKEAAEDVVQETFLSAFKSVSNFKGKSSEKTWLVSILKRRIVDFYRKEAQKQERNISSYQLPFQKEGLFENHWIEQRAPKNWDTDKQLHFDEFHRILQYCLSLLPPKHRLVFMMKILDECDSDEVCAEVNISASNLWTIMHRARLQVRECVENKWL